MSSRLSTFLQSLAMAKQKLETKYRKLLAYLGSKRKTRRFIVIAFLLSFITVTNLTASTKEYQAGVIFLPNDKLLPMLLKDLGSAESEIKCSLFIFKTDGNKQDATGLILGSMIEAHKRGVKVDILLDIGEDGDISTLANQDTGKILAQAGVTVYYDDPDKKLHTKMCIIDEKISYIGSHNYTYTAMNKNTEVTLRVNSIDIAKEAINFIDQLGVK